MSLLNTTGRSLEIADIARRFETEHLTNPDARQIAMAFARLATEMLLRIRRDDAELVRGLSLLADARDAMMRAVIYTGTG